MQQHTPGPWRWEVKEKEKAVHLISDASMRPLVMEFERWGFQGAAPRFRNWAWGSIMQSLETWLARKDSGKAECIDHPDARLIAAAPDMLEALEDLVKSVWPADKAAAYAKARAAIAKAKGTPAPIEASQAV